MSEKFQKDLEQVLFDEHLDSWVGFQVGGPIPFSIVSIYAWGNAATRCRIWGSLKDIKGPILLLGDFNMVEHRKDRYKGLGQILHGEEKKEWNQIKDLLSLYDMGVQGDFTWQNYSKDPLARKARLDRCYISNNLANMFIRIKARAEPSICLSDHYPLIIHLDDKDKKMRSEWFHTDPQLFSLPIVKQEIESIWSTAFSSSETPARKWASAILASQKFLISIKKQVTAIRRKRKEETTAALKLAESKANKEPGNLQDELVQLRAQLRREELQEGRDLKIFFKNWWIDKSDRPVKEMFHLLKKNRAWTFCPCFRNLMGARRKMRKRIYHWYSNIMKLSSKPLYKIL